MRTGGLWLLAGIAIVIVFGVIARTETPVPYTVAGAFLAYGGINLLLGWRDRKRVTRDATTPVAVSP